VDGGDLVQREDDSEGVILRRLADYQKSSRPLVEYYADSDYHRIDGAREPESILEELLEIGSRRELLIQAFGD
jgi:adenylate kinase family enzyme